MAVKNPCLAAARAIISATSYGSETIGDAVYLMVFGSSRRRCKTKISELKARVHGSFLIAAYDVVFIQVGGTSRIGSIGYLYLYLHCQSLVPSLT